MRRPNRSPKVALASCSRSSFVNTGNVEGQGGVLYLNGGGSGDGSFTIEDGAELRLGGDNSNHHGIHVKILTDTAANTVNDAIFSTFIQSFHYINPSFSLITN